MSAVLTRYRARTAGIIAGVVAAVIAILLIILIACGINPAVAAEALVRGAFGTWRSFGETLVRVIPLLLIAATLAPSLRARIFNMGAPGQMGLGALAATTVSLAAPNLPSPVLWLACGIAAAIAGVVAATIPAFLKARWGINEIITSIAINFIVAYLLMYLLAGPMKGATANSAQSEPLPMTAWVPSLESGTRAHWGIVIAILVVIALMVLDRTRPGYRLAVFAVNPSLAKQAGVHPRSTVFGLMLVAGVGAGLAGWLQVAAVDHRLYPTISDPVGYAGLFVALLGALHPIGILIAAVLMGALLQGGASLQVGAGVAPEVVQVLIGLVLLAYAVLGRFIGKNND